MLIELIGDALILAFGALSLRVFIPIIIWGEVLIVESNSVILTTELLLAAVIVFIGIQRLIDDIRSLRK